MFILLSVINKDFGIGYKQACKVLKGELLYYPFQLAKKFSEKEIINIIRKYPREDVEYVYVQPKYDGIRIIYNPAKGEFYTRNQDVLTLDKYPNLTFIKENFDRLIDVNPNLENYVFDGELFAGDWDTTMHIVTTEKELPDNKLNKLCFYVFDCINRYNFENYDLESSIVDDIPLIERYNVIEEVLNTIIDYDVRFNWNIAFFLKNDVRYKSTNIELFYSELPIYLKDYEGMMIKFTGLPYFEGRKSAWLKLKPQNELEAVIIDIQEGDGRMQEMVGAFLVKSVIKGKEVVFKVGSGLTDVQRKKFWMERNNLIGRIIDVQYQELTKDCIPRFPVFVRLRTDKNELNFE